MARLQTGVLSARRHEGEGRHGGVRKVGISGKASFQQRDAQSQPALPLVAESEVCAVSLRWQFPSVGQKMALLHPGLASQRFMQACALATPGHK